MADVTKRELREEKREIKRAGVKRVRQQLKRGLAENPDEAPFAEVSFGRYSSTRLNGLDRDATRRQEESDPGPTAAGSNPE